MGFRRSQRASQRSDEFSDERGALYAGARQSFPQLEVTDQGGVLSVSDNGIGIAPEDIPRVTERFYRVDKSRSRETGGTGLGLAIVKHVLFRHQAQLQIESEIGKGSTFKIVIPKVRLFDEEEELLGAPAEAAERSVISKSDLIH